ncbi:NACHT and WD repeat domain-containing protein [Streptomyces sp. NPDC050548]|uniref:NACHT and WD repeat domain-containing protein n=1 Tax=Streptomyces sp. NPDC050548 TaxID=3365629 RepID=UPI00379B3F9F
MRQRSLLPVQIVVLVSATLLEVLANFAANAAQSPVVRLISRIAPLAVVVLICVVIAGQVVVQKRSNPAAPRPAWDSDRTPYPGLAAFDRGDAAVFFGREDEIAGIIRRLHLSAQQPEERFVCLTGTSGSGKSSLVHAGVLPRLLESRWRLLPVIVPGADPLRHLEEALAARPRGVAAVRSGRTLLVVDQLEELVTASPPERRERFLGGLAEALREDRRLWVMATLRVEFLPEFLASAQQELFTAPTALGAMSTAELVAAVEQPARLAGGAFEPGLVARIVEDTGTADALPLLAYLLRELYLSVGDSKIATKESYLALGGVTGALARQADEVFATVVEEHGADTVLTALLLLVGMEAGEPVKRRVPTAELSPTEREILRPFDAARLLVVTRVDDVPAVQVAHEALFRQWPPLQQQVTVRAELLKSRSELERWAADWQASGRSPDYLLTGERLAVAGRWLAGLETADGATVAVRELVVASRSRDRDFLLRVSESIGQYVLANAEREPEFGTLLAATVLTECPPTSTAVRALMTALAHNHTRAVLIGHRAGVRAMSWSPDGACLATGSLDGTVRLWDAATGAAGAVLEGHGDGIVAVHWSPDARLLATGSRDRTARVWDPLTGRTVAVLDAATDTVRDVAFSPDGELLATCSRDRRIRVFATAGWAQVAEPAGHSDEIYQLAWSPDGTRLLSAAYDRSYILWLRENWRPQRVGDRPSGHATPFGWTVDGAFLVSGEQWIKVIDAATGQVRQVFPERSELIVSLRCSPAGDSFALSSRGPEVRIRTLDHGDVRARLCGHATRVETVAWSPTGEQLAAGAEDGAARIWSVDVPGAELYATARHPGLVTGLDLSPDGELIASGAADGVVRIWSAHDGSPVAALAGHGTSVNDLRWHPHGGALASCADDDTVRIWRPAADGTWAGAEAGTETVLTTEETVEALAWSPDGGRLALGRRDQRATVLDAGTGQVLGRYGEHSQWVCAVAWSPRADLLATGSDDHTAQLWDVASTTLRHRLVGHQSWVDAVTFAPDGARLATSSADLTVRLWDTATGEQAAELRGHEARIRAVAFAPDGRLLATASDDRTVRLWDARTGQEHRVIGIHRDRVQRLAWFPDGRRVATASEDGTVRVWGAGGDLDALLATARERIFRTLTPNERRTHLLPE